MSTGSVSIASNDAADVLVYNGVLERREGWIVAKRVSDEDLNKLDSC
jgi:hypothetical protein